MADNYFLDPTLDQLFEEDLAEFVAPFGLPAPLASPFTRLEASAPSDRSGFRSVYLGPSPPIIAPPNLDPFASQPGFLRTGHPPPSAFGIPPLSRCPANPANRPFLTSPFPTLPPLPSPAHFGPPFAHLLPPTDPLPLPQNPLRPLLGEPQTPLGTSTAANLNSDDDYFLNELATRHFSSPSILHESPRDTIRAAASSRDCNPEPGQCSGGADIKRETPSHGLAASTTPGGYGEDMPTRLQRPTRDPAGSSAHAQADGMPFASSSTSTRRDASALQNPPRPTSGQAVGKRKRDESVKIESLDFGSDALQDVIDLANTDQVPASLLAPPKPKKHVRLSTFQCVICMDDVTDLTVTHCGHLFCGECLHSSLHIDAHKKICPICRQKIDSRPASGKFGPKAKGYYSLELKLTTKKSLGKRADKT